MSFFGFDTTLPQGRGSKHPVQAAGFGRTEDAFAGLSLRPGNLNDNEEDNGIDFEDTYDGLGDKLDEGDDVLNDETFGITNNDDTGKDFDFFGSTAKAAPVMNQAHSEYQSTSARKLPQHQPLPQQRHQTHGQHHTQAQNVRNQRSNYPTQGTAVRPRNDGRSNIPEQIPDLKPEMSLWQSSSGTVPQATRSNLAQAHFQHLEDRESPLPPKPTVPSTERKFMSLEEVEAQILSQAQNRSQVAPSIAQSQPSAQHNNVNINTHHIPNQHPAQYAQQVQLQQPPIFGSNINPQVLAHQQMLKQQMLKQQYLLQQHAISQQQQGLSMLPQIQGFPSLANQPQPSQFNNNLMFPLGMQQLSMELTEEEQMKLLKEEERRLKRNHKIAQLARYNGLMTPSDKNFISKIQLQQLVSVNNDDAFSEDFYYQVHMSMNSFNPQQQGQFAQTYATQAGLRGLNGRGRRQDNHLQRMEQQVQRAVAAAKARPKTSQLVLEGSLGKISFSNVKTPKPLLSIKKSEVSAGAEQARKAHKLGYEGIDRKALLKALETIYDNLMEIDLLERSYTLSLLDNTLTDTQKQDYVVNKETFINKMWKAMKIMEPINPSSSILHPFIALLSYNKGKKAIPRAFRYIDGEQRVTILTMIVVHLDHLDVVKHGHYLPGETDLPKSVREAIDTFSNSVLPPLLQYVSEAPINIIIGLLGILLERVDVVLASQTRIGLAFLTMFTSRAEIIKQSSQADAAELTKWGQTYNRLFSKLENHITDLFPPSEVVTDDVYVWQFLASMAVGASMQQQQSLVTAVKDQVMENVMASKTLPAEQGAQKAANTNLFMRAIGLDIDLLA